MGILVVIEIMAHKGAHYEKYT